MFSAYPFQKTFLRRELLLKIELKKNHAIEIISLCSIFTYVRKNKNFYGHLKIITKQGIQFLFTSRTEVNCSEMMTTEIVISDC